MKQHSPHLGRHLGRHPSVAPTLSSSILLTRHTGTRRGRHLRCRVDAIAQVSKEDKKAAAKQTTSSIDGEASGTPEPQPAASSTTIVSPPDDATGMMAVKINAVASKINAARELARRLAEEKQAQAQGDEAMRSAEEASAAAAAQAARADALARALRKAETTRDQLARLKAENEALRDLLLELAADKDAAKTRLTQVADAAAVAVARAAAAAGLRGSPASSLSPSEAPASPALSSPPPTPSVAASTAVAEPPAAAPVKETPAAAAAPPVAPTPAPAPAPVKETSAAAAPPPAPAPAPAVKPAEVSPAPPVAPPAPEVPPPQPIIVPEETAVPETSAAQPTVVTPEVVEETAVEETAPVLQEPAQPVEVEAEPAPRGLLQDRTPREEVQDRVAATQTQLQQLAAAAVRAGISVFTFPREPVPIDGPVKIFYNRARGPLPSNASVVVKVGFNKWDIVYEQAMTPATFLQQTIDQQWWETTVEVPAETFKVDYVFFDQRSQIYDNNQFRDYNLRLLNAPTEEELMELRLEAWRTFEYQRKKYLESENARLWRAVEIAALEAAGVARIDFRMRREKNLKAEAEELVQQRRQVELSGVDLADVMPGVYAWTVKPVAGKKAFLAYNKGRGPLNHSSGVRLHVGYDGWWMQVKQVYDMKMMPSEEVNRAGLNKHNGPQQWWGCWVDVPHSGMIMDFVLSDNNQVNWDNNNYKDYHARIDGAKSASELSELLAQALHKEREQQDQEAEDRYARHAYQSVLGRGEVLRKRRAVCNEFLYTVPYTPVAGQKVEVYYNPEHSPLRGRPNIYVRAGFNRWTLQTASPTYIKMEPTVAGGIGFYTATIELPTDAWGLDMLFIDTPVEGQVTGFYDDNQGLTYHMPVRTPEDGNKPIGAVKIPVRVPLKVMHVAVEMAPIAKVGGMGDVVTALGRACQEEGHTVEVVIPKYDCLDYKQVGNLRQDGQFNFGGTTVRVWKGDVEGLPTVFLEPENGHFWRGCIYGRGDDHVRFGFHCGAALAYMHTYGLRPNIIHCHDWQTAPIAWGNRGSARCIFTIHNFSYGADMVARAMASCELATTVSPTYAREVVVHALAVTRKPYLGCFMYMQISGQGAIAPHLHKLYGILNGIDTDVWDPADDPYIPKPYCADTAYEGKEAARRELRDKLKLSHVNAPIVAVVTRLVAQKGIHLIKHAAWRTLERGGQFVLLGSAPDPRVQGEFNALRDQLKAQYHDRAALEFTYNEPLSHLIYAGSDIFLVPSMFEPCGLTQMIAMKYGSIPVVRKTGGLNDTVFDVDHDEERAAAAGMDPNGFSFESTDNAGLDYALNRALSMWYNEQPAWQRLVSTTMHQDWSWFKPAMDYIDLYHKALRL